jgi:hypothetical protein
VPSADIELAQRTIETFNAGVRRLPEFWAEDAELRPAPGFPESSPCSGREEIQRFFDRLREGLTDARIVLNEIEEAGDKVLVSLEWRATGESSGVETSSDW